MCPGPPRGPSWLRRCPPGPRAHQPPAGTSHCISPQTPGPRAGGSAPRCPCREQHEQRQVSKSWFGFAPAPAVGLSTLWRRCWPLAQPDGHGGDRAQAAAQPQPQPQPRAPAAETAAAAPQSGGWTSGPGAGMPGSGQGPPSWFTDLSACPQEAGAAWGLLLWGRQARRGAPPAASADPHRLQHQHSGGWGLTWAPGGHRHSVPRGPGNDVDSTEEPAGERVRALGLEPGEPLSWLRGDRPRGRQRAPPRSGLGHRAPSGGWGSRASFNTHGSCPGRPPRPGAPTPRAECDETSPRVTGPHTALELGRVCPSEMRTLDP